MQQPVNRVLQVILGIVVTCSVVWLTISGSVFITDEVGEATLVQQSFVVQGEDATQVAAVVESYGGMVARALPVIDGVQAYLTPPMAEALTGDASVSFIMRDAPVQAVDLGSDMTPVGQATADYGEVVGADVVWGGEDNPTGDGITVAVVDTGIDDNLQGIKFAADGKRDIVAVNFVDGSNTVDDENGHGTHMAGIIGSSWEGDDGNWNGIAPNVDLVSVRVLGETGVGTYSSVIAGIQWVIDHKDEHNIRVMNLSLVATPQSPYWADPLNQAVMAAWDAGIVVVAAAGNGGPAPMAIGVPGNTPYVITAGAFTDNYTLDDWSDDYITPFSAAGPTLDAFVKPDVVAPGAHMVSTMMPDSYLVEEHDLVKISGQHVAMAGTSQATAVVSGIAALILSHPDNAGLTPDQVKYRLMHTALLWMDEAAEEPAPLYSVWQQGAGRVNAPDAVFTDTIEAANYGITLTVDLADPEGGYQGYTYYDPESGYFYLYEMPETWANGYSTWAGGYSTWAGGYSTWAGGYSTWAGGYSTWAGGYSTWAGGYTGWLETPLSAQSMETTAVSDTYPWPDYYNEEAFLDAYIAGDAPEQSTPLQWGEWVDEKDWADETDVTELFIPMLMAP